jgi:hypothetical protein
MEPLKIFVGYDSREDIAWQVCRFSLQRHASRPLQVTPLRQTELRERGLYTRPIDATAATEFSLTRFLTPWLAASEDWSVFVDCDFLYTTDVYKMLSGLDTSKAVYVVQHDYTPKNAVKMDGKLQHTYPRKNWSSLIVFNGAHPDVKALTPEVVNTQSPAYLHRFSWVADDAAIGALDLTWNFLEGEYPKPEKAPNAIHFTNGGPWFDNWSEVDYADLWRQERDLYQSTRAAAE